MFERFAKGIVFFMILGIWVSIFEKDDINKNEIFSEGGNGQRFAIIEVAKAEQARENPIKERNTTIHSSAEAQAMHKVTDPTYVEETVAVEANIDENVPEERQPIKVTEAEMKASYHKGYLTARKGYVTDSPCGPNGNDGYETWYPTHPGGAVKILAKEKGFTNLKMEVCKEEGPRKGVRIISGYTPDGQYFENLIVVAADIVCDNNPDGAFERGDFIETSLGPGLIVDFCERAVNERKNNNRTHIDIATNWYN